VGGRLQKEKNGVATTKGGRESAGKYERGYTEGWRRRGKDSRGGNTSLVAWVDLLVSSPNGNNFGVLKQLYKFLTRERRDLGYFTTPAIGKGRIVCLT